MGHPVQVLMLCVVSVQIGVRLPPLIYISFSTFKQLVLLRLNNLIQNNNNF